MLKIQTLRFNDNYVYVITLSGRSVVVDPSDAGIVLRYIEDNDLELIAVLNTHGHYDHICGNETLKKTTGCEIIINDYRVSAEVFFQCILTPGHTKDSRCFYLHPFEGFSGAVFTGDTLFYGGCGRILDGTVEQMWSSFIKLAALPDETLIYCGHDYTQENYAFSASVVPEIFSGYEPYFPSTIGKEKQENIFMNCDNPRLKDMLSMHDWLPSDVFAYLRCKKDNF